MTRPASPTGAPVPHDAVLHDAVLARARSMPDAVAVRQWDVRLSYRRLDDASAALAGVLTRTPGVSPDAAVAVCARRSPGLVTALVGVLRAGSAYLPIDPDLPAARAAAMLEETGTGVAVVDEAGRRLLAGTGCRFVELPSDAVDPARTDPPAAPVERPVHQEQTAYVMFTSGSTGRPKAVAISHRSALSWAAAFADRTGLTSGDRCLAYASIGFDASIMDIVVPLAAGATIALVPDSDRLDPTRLQDFLRAHQVSWGYLPVAVFPLLDPAALADWRVVIGGGESIGPEQVGRWTAGRGRRLIHAYGPAETTVSVTAYDAAGDWDRPVPIGFAYGGHNLHVVDENLRPVPAGAPGELLVGGPGLARGYLGRPGATAAAFVPDPFGSRPGARLYRTGDLVSVGPDGAVVFLGRIDRQVKIRGQRVEIGEIEATLRGHPRVRHAAVDLRQDPAGERHLVAYVTLHGRPTDGTVGATTGGATTVNNWLRGYCAERLPAAMVPGQIHCPADLPLTASGKVDLALLATLFDTAGSAGPDHEAAGLRDTAESAALADAWRDVLGAPVPAAQAGFFHCGGHSITAMRLVSALRERLGREVTIDHVLTGRTFAGIADQLRNAPNLSGGPALTGHPAAVSPSQQRLWFLERYAPAAAAAYTVSFAERLRGRLDHTALAAALSAVHRRHQILRWRIEERDGTPLAVVDPPAPVPLPVEDLRATARPLREWLHELANQAFDLATDRLWRACLLRLAENDHVLVISAHHAVFDGWSQSLLYRDLSAAYSAYVVAGETDVAGDSALAGLPPLPATFGDYVAWRNRRDQTNGAADLAWYVQHLAGAPTVLELPDTGTRAEEQTYHGAKVGGWLDPATTAAVIELARGRDATLSAVLLAALGVVLARWSGHHDLLVGTPMADRRLAEFEPLIGFFIDIAPLRLRFDPTASFDAALDAARDELLAALAHPQPVDRLVDVLGLGGRLDRNPLVQVLFNVFNYALAELALPGVSAEPVEMPVPGSPFDLTVYGIPRGDKIRLELVYNADLFTEARMRSLLDDLAGLLARAAVEPTVPVGRLRPARPGEPAQHGGQASRTTAEPRPRTTADRRAGPGPATPTERQIAAVWQETLGRPVESATTSFFAAGGTSVLLVAVARRLGALFGRDLPVVELFRHPTVRTLAGRLDATAAAGAGPTAGSTAESDALDRAARRGSARRDRGRRRVAGTTGRTSPSRTGNDIDEGRG